MQVPLQGALGSGHHSGKGHPGTYHDSVSSPAKQGQCQGASHEMAGCSSMPPPMMLANKGSDGNEGRGDYSGPGGAGAGGSRFCMWLKVEPRRMLMDWIGCGGREERSRRGSKHCGLSKLEKSGPFKK